MFAAVKVFRVAVLQSWTSSECLAGWITDWRLARLLLIWRLRPGLEDSLARAGSASWSGERWRGEAEVVLEEAEEWRLGVRAGDL